MVLAASPSLMFLAARRFEELMRMRVIYEGAFGKPCVCSAGRHLAQRLFASFHCGIFFFALVSILCHICVHWPFCAVVPLPVSFVASISRAGG